MSFVITNSEMAYCLYNHTGSVTHRLEFVSSERKRDFINVVRIKNISTYSSFLGIFLILWQVFGVLGEFCAKVYVFWLELI